MKDSYQEKIISKSSTKFIPGQKMASAPSGKAKELSATEPQVIGNNKYRIVVESFFHCRLTGIKFHVKTKTEIEYSLEYGNDYMNLIRDNGYELLGPIFNVQVISGKVATVYLPHYVCLENFEGDRNLIKFGDLKDGKVKLKTPTRTESSHLVLENPSFSCVAPVGEQSLIFWKRKPFPFNGKVLLYFRVVCPEKEEFMEYRIHLFLIPTDKPDLERLDYLKSTHGFKRIDKPSQAKNVFTNKDYIIKGKPSQNILPQTLQFPINTEIEHCPYTEINTTKQAILKNGEQLIFTVETEESLQQEPVWKGLMTRADIEELAAKEIQRGDFSEHFVIKHRIALVQRVTSINPVLDDLKGQKLLTKEHYDTIRKEATPQDKMRELFRSVEGWGHADKETLHKILLCHNEPIIRQIEKGN
ncbi:NACHT, LRR and PYD domains-containing protein 1b allele 3-like [Engystomops pustulosus]|uniref:NACHT, LRR and PYD domains-containing protein 1b allele 3-like n=1 Tax=Engystomops pustulosus TaxID=76066 RepID=UPI003AFA52DD